MRLASSLPAGVSALLFESASRLRALEADLAAELEARDFREAVLPMVDYFAPYEPLLPPAARSELYRFADREGELLALRSDFTPLLARLIARDGLTAAAAEQRLAAQMPIEEKARRANYVIDTSGTFDDTDRRVQAVWSALRSVASPLR